MSYHSPIPLDLADIIDPLDPSVNKVGENLAIKAGNTEDIWDGGDVYSYPITNDITHISQSSNQVLLQGATVQVKGIKDVAGIWIVETQTVALDASDTTTLIPLTTSLIRIIEARLLSSIRSTSDINITDSAGSTIFAIIRSDQQKTLMAMTSTPSNRIGVVLQWWYDAIETDADPGSGDPGLDNPKESVIFDLQTANRDLDIAFETIIKRPIGITINTGASPPHMFNPHILIPPKSDVKISASAIDKDAHVFAGFDMALCPIDLFVAGSLLP